MIMARNEDGTYSQVGFVKDNAGIDTEYIYDKDGDIVFEKGFTRETSGTVPLTINGIGKDLKDWSITGNTVQNGTPTPENPVEVVGVGDRTGNLFNLQSWTNATTDTRSYFQLSITLYNGSTSLGECRFDVHETGRVVLTSATAGADGATRLAIKHNGSTRDLAIGSVYDDFPANQPLTISFDVSGYDPTIAGGISISNIMLNSGSSALPFEPYGYKIPVVTRGKNLFDKENASPKAVTNQGVFVNNSSYISSNYISVSPNTTYTKIPIIKSGQFHDLCEYDENKIFIRHIFTANNGTFTTSEKTKYIVFNIAKFNIDIAQLEKGSTATPYEPYHEPIITPIYLPTPLYSGEVMRSDGSRDVKFGKLVLTGEEAITTHKPFADGTVSIRIPSSKAKSNGIIYCTHLQNVIFTEMYNNEKQGISSHLKNDLDNLYCLISGFTKLTQYKDFFRNEYSAGTPVTVWYKLAEPTTETFTAPQIPTINGTTVIDVDTAVKPTEMYTKYKSSK